MVAYSITPDIESALQDIMGRVTDRYRKSPRQGSVEASALREDESRIGLLQALAQLSTDPHRSATIDQGVQAQVDLATANANDQAAATRGNVVMDAASRGLLGGSGVSINKGRIASARDQSVRDAAASADDWRTSVLGGDQDYLAGLLQEILAPTGESQGAMQAQMQGFQTNLGLGEQLQSVREQQNQILAQTLGGITGSLGNTISAASAVNRSNNADRRDAGQKPLSIWEKIAS